MASIRVLTALLRESADRRARITDLGIVRAPTGLLRESADFRARITDLGSARALMGLLRESADLLLASECAGCARPETALCESCRLALAADGRSGRTPGGLRVRAALPFRGVPARVVRAIKEGQTELIRVLSPALRAAVLLAVEETVAAEEGHSDTPLIVVAVPTSRRSFRQRGFALGELLVRRAGFAATRVLVPARRVRDQRGLGRADRARNVRGSFRCRRRGSGQCVLLVDDVMTTGATLDEAALVLREAGFRVPAAVVLAATPHEASGLIGAASTG